MDGSFGTINYLSNGSNAFPKENIQVFCAGRVLSLENFRVLKGYGWPKFKSFKTWRQDKGQKECIKSFLTAINANQPAIHFNELFEVASISLEVAKILRQKK